MADANANPTASCGNGTMTARGYPVSMQTDCDCLLDNAAHKNNVLPNGCLKHSLEENGRVKPLENTDKTSITVCENLIKTDDAFDACSCNDHRDLRLCECENVSKCTVASTVSTQCVNSKTTGQNGEHVQELESDASGVDTSSEGVAKLTLSESGYQESHSLEVKTSIGSTTTSTSICRPDVVGHLEYVVYESELQMPYIMRLITKDLSEPYSIYTYRYFIHNWPRLCFLTMDKGKYVGAIVCKHDLHKKMVRRGYIAMLAVDHNYRRNGVGSHLVMKAIRAMVAEECDEVVLETEITNKAALRLYENLGFLRDKRLFRYYLNGVDALRLKLWLR